MHGSRHGAGEMSCRRCPYRRHMFFGGCSRVEYQWIGAGMLPGDVSTVPSGSWKALRVGVRVDRLAHCWVLRQQDRGRFSLRGGVFMVVVCFCLFLRRPEASGGHRPLRGGGCGCGWV